jgi:hypothetical protein
LTASFAEELFQALQTNHLVTAAYHPQCNGLVERYNHTFAEMLSMYVNSYHNDWDGLIDFVTFAYNTSRQETTGYSPFYLLYGWEAVLPIDVALGNNPDLGLDDGDPSDRVRTLTAKLSQIREEVKGRMAAIQIKQKSAMIDGDGKQVLSAISCLSIGPFGKRGARPSFFIATLAPTVLCAKCAISITSSNPCMVGERSWIKCMCPPSNHFDVELRVSV